MALKISKVVHKGNEARKKNKERVRISAVPVKKSSLDYEVKPLIYFPDFTVYTDDTILSISCDDKFLAIVADVFSGLVIDSNYRIFFSSKEVDRYKGILSELLNIFVSVDGAKYKLSREKGVTSYIPLFSRVDINEKEFLAVLNPLFGVVVKDDKFIVARRDKKQTRYSIRLENILRKYSTGRVEFKIPTLVKELGASVNYVKNFSQFFTRTIKESVDIINNNDNGVYVKDYDRIEDTNVVWFEIEVN